MTAWRRMRHVWCKSQRLHVCSPANTKHLYNIYTLLDQRQRRWSSHQNIENYVFDPIDGHFGLAPDLPLSHSFCRCITAHIALDYYIFFIQHFVECKISFSPFLSDHSRLCQCPKCVLSAYLTQFSFIVFYCLNNERKHYAHEVMNYRNTSSDNVYIRAHKGSVLGVKYMKF